MPAALILILVVALVAAVLLMGGTAAASSGDAGTAGNQGRGAQAPGPRGAQAPRYQILEKGGVIAVNPRGTTDRPIWLDNGAPVMPDGPPDAGTYWEVDRQRPPAYVLKRIPDYVQGQGERGAQAPSVAEQTEAAEAASDRYGESYPDEGWGSGEGLASLLGAAAGAGTTAAIIIGGGDPKTALTAGKAAGKVGEATGKFTGSVGLEAAERMQDAARRKVQELKDQRDKRRNERKERK